MEIHHEINEIMSSKSEDKYTIRKSKKPLMEKRRRQRINNCLQQLKSLVLQAMKKDTSHYSKLEKADILEMTVKHLRMLQRRQISSAVAADPTVATKYNVGFSECASEVIRYMSTVQGVNQEVKARIMAHLDCCLQTMTAQASMMAPVQPLQVQIPSSQNEALHHQMYTPAERLLTQTTVRQFPTPNGQTLLSSYDLLSGNTFNGHLRFLGNPDYQNALPFSQKASMNTAVNCRNSAKDIKGAVNCTSDAPVEHISSGSSRCHATVGEPRSSSSPSMSPILCALKEERVWRPW